MKKEGRPPYLRWLEEFILFIIIILNIMDFFSVLPGDLGYIKKVLSWTALGYLFYHASLTRIFFNERHHYVDFFLIISYFLMISKNIVASFSAENTYLFREMHAFLAAIGPQLQSMAFVLGSSLVILLALYSAMAINIRSPSMMQIFHEQGPSPHNPLKILLRYTTLFISFFGFFLIVFNLSMEWLAIALDAPILMIALFFYIYLAIGHYRKYHLESLLYKIGEFTDGFYERFISLFHDKRTLFMGITGMLVLHILTDIGNFIIPYLFFFRESPYLESLGAGHEPLIGMMLSHISQMPALDKISLVAIYALNVIGIVMLMLIPALLWYAMFTGKEIRIPKLDIAFFFSAMAAMIFAPAFRISKIAGSSLIGVDILTQQPSVSAFRGFFALAFFCFTVFLAVVFLEAGYKRALTIAGLFSGLAFFAWYTALFFISTLSYYASLIGSLAAASSFYFAMLFGIFLKISILFYLGAFLLFVDELFVQRAFGKIR